MENRNTAAQAAGAQSAVLERAPYPSEVAERFLEPTPDRTPWQNVYFLPAGDVLGKHHFLEQMRREKLRTNRSKAPLSVVLFRFEARNLDALGGVKALLRILHHSKRETDILGCLREDLVALLFPDTDEQGMETFMRKIKPRIERFGASTNSGTYPEQLFDQLLAEPRDLSRLPWLAVSNQNENSYRLKRTLDIAGAIVGIFLLTPLMLITAIAVALDSRGPILFRQTRVGRGGVPFVLYKFRSTFVNADDRVHPAFVKKPIPGKLEEVNQGDTDNPCYKTKSHPSVTRVGSFIHATSIDEFPQLFNVLKGNMSLVGPQPLLPYEIENYESWTLMQILELKPGITGPWRVEGHSSTIFNDMVRFDLRHIPSCSLILDLSILLKTVKMLLRWI